MRYVNENITLVQADCLDELGKLEARSVTGVCTDPPYGLGFMAKDWDKQLPPREVWRECLRVSAPGAYLLAFGGSRTFHRLYCHIEEAGWILRDTLCWLYGQGFPKSYDISTGVDNLLGFTRPRNVVPQPRSKLHGDRPWLNDPTHRFQSREPISNEAKTWSGYGTALKPAWEPICLAQKALDKTYARTALNHGCGGLAVQECSVGDELRINAPASNKGGGNSLNLSLVGMPQDALPRERRGRFPANVLLDEAAGAILGEPSRFFYCPKASQKDRGDGNIHPTVKPTALIEYLLRLIRQPEDNLILDPFMGSGTTGVICARLGIPFIGIELDNTYFQIARGRIERALDERKEACGD